MGNIIYPLWAECPALTRLVCTSAPGLSLVLILAEMTPAGWIVEWLFNCSLMEMSRFHVWTLFLTSFYSQMLSSGFAFLFGLMTVYMMMMGFPAREKEMGSTSFLLWMFIITALINIVYLCFNWILVHVVYRTSPQAIMYMMISSHGFWPLILVSITLQSLSDPNGQTSFWGFVMIPNKWYPIALVGVFSLMNGLRILWDLVAALVVGYGFVYFHLERFMPAPARAGWLEQQFPCCRGGRLSVFGAAWIPATSTTGYSYDTTMSDFGRTSGQTLTGGGRGGGSNFEAFAGSGNVLGDGSNEPQRPQESEPQPMQADEEQGRHAGGELPRMES